MQRESWWRKKKTAQELSLMTVNLLRSNLESQWVGLQCSHPALYAGQGSKLGDFICFQSFDDDYVDFETKIQDLDRRLATIFCQGFDGETAILLSPVQR